MYLGLGLGLRSAGAAIDPDAAAIIAAIEGPTGDNQALESTVRNAINDFVVGCKSDLIWTALSAGVFRLLAGPRTLAGIAKCGVGVDPTNIGFVSGDIVRATGLMGNGSSKSLNTNRRNNEDGQNDNHLSVMVTTLGTPNGSYIGTTTSPQNAITGNLTTIGIYSNSNDVDIFNISNVVPTFIAIDRALSTEYKFRRNSSTVTIVRNSAGLTTHFTHVFARGTAVGQDFFGSPRIAFFSKGPSIEAVVPGGLALLQTRLNTYLSSIAGI